jgi:hypothetical protein
MKLDYTTDRQRRLASWTRNRHHTDGNDAVKNPSVVKDYVKQKSTMDNDDYDFVMAGTEYFAMAARTLQSFGGLVFRKDPLFDGNLLFPEAVSVEGQTAEELARAIFREYMITNDGGVFVDTPDTPAGVSVKELEKLNLYSYQTLYPAESIREIRFKAINGRKRLVYVRLVEDEDHGRELELVDNVYVATIWKKTADGWKSSTITPLIGDKPLNDIPFIPLSDSSNGAAMDNLCATNVVHFVKAFLLANAAAWVTAPIMAIAGAKPEETDDLDASFGAYWVFENENAKWGFIEYKGDGVPIIERDLDRLEQHGSMLGSRMLIQEKSVSEAEGTVARRQAGENSILASAARHVAAVETKALKLQATMMGKDATEVKYTLNTDFVPAIMEPAFLTALFSGREKNLIPNEAYFEALQKGDVVDASWTYEQFAAALEMQSGTTGNTIS